jgi:hypothetical protein
MAEDKPEPAQTSQPKGIKRRTFDRLLRRRRKPAKRQPDLSNGGRNFIDFC